MEGRHIVVFTVAGMKNKLTNLTAEEWSIKNDTDAKRVTFLNHELQQKTHQLIFEITSQQPDFIGFSIEPISKENEKHCLINGIKNLKVTQLDQSSHLHQVINFWNKNYKVLDESTLYVERMPGFVIINENTEEVVTLIKNINNIKDTIATVVRDGRNHHQKHEFIHNTLNGVMTEQLYRHIHVIEKHVENIWFNWVSRPVPITMTLEEAHNYVERFKEIPQLNLSEKDWISELNKTQNDIKSGGFSYIQRNREFKVFPTIELACIDSDGIKKPIRKNATTPFILVGQVNKSLPKFTTLSDYEFNHLRKRKSQKKVNNNKVNISEFLHLTGVIKAHALSKVAKST